MQICCIEENNRGFAHPVVLKAINKVQITTKIKSERCLFKSLPPHNSLFSFLALKFREIVGFCQIKFIRKINFISVDGHARPFSLFSKQKIGTEIQENMESPDTLETSR